MKKGFIISILLVGLFFILSSPVYGQINASSNLEGVGGIIGYDTETGLIGLIASIIRIVLGFLGIIAIIIMIIAGFKWMTAGGSAEKVKNAKALLKNGLIGLLIIVFAYSIVTFILGELSGLGPGPEPYECGNGICEPGENWINCPEDCEPPPPGDVFSVTEIQTTYGEDGTNYSEDVYRCSAVQPIFNRLVDSSQIDNLAGSGNLRIENLDSNSIVSGEWQTRGKLIVFTHPELFAANSNFSTYLPKAILDRQSNVLQKCLADPACSETANNFQWIFEVGDKLDDIAPEIVSTYPTSNKSSDYYPDRTVSTKPNIEVEFSEGILATTVISGNSTTSAPVADNIYVEKINNENGNVLELIDNEDWQVDISGNSFILSLKDEITLDPFAWYRVHVEGIEDLCMNVMDGSLEWKFQTNDNSPGVHSWNPTGENVCPDTNIAISFNTSMRLHEVEMAIDPENSDSYTFSIYPYDFGEPYEKDIKDENNPDETIGVFSVLDPEPGGFRVFSFNPANNLEENTNYDIDVVTTLVMNQSGGRLSKSWDFSTTTLEDCECSPWIHRVDPSEGGPGECITLSGSCFTGTFYNSAIPQNLTLHLNDTPTTGEIQGYGDGYITSVVPQSFSDGDNLDIDFEIEYEESGSIALSNQIGFFVNTNEAANGPCLFKAQPDVGFPKQTNVDLEGIRFGEENTDSKVIFYDNKEASFDTWFDSYIDNSLVPQGAETGDLKVKNTIGTSNAIPFTVTDHPLPEIGSITPYHGTNNPNIPTYVTIKGSDFGHQQDNRLVKFGDTVAEIGCNNWSSNHIVAIVPESLTENTYSVKIIDPGWGESNSKDFTVDNTFHPAICELNPNHGEMGANFNIEGMNFGDNQGDSYVEFGCGTSSAVELSDFEENEWSNTTINAQVPEITNVESDVAVYVPSPIEDGNPPEQSNLVPFYKTPVIQSITPDNGRAKDWITIRGENFLPDDGGYVNFIDNNSNVYVGQTLPDYCGDTWKDNEIIIQVPEDLPLPGENSTNYIASIYITTSANVDSNEVDWEVNKDPLSAALCTIDPNQQLPGFSGVTIQGKRFELGGDDFSRELYFSPYPDAQVTDLEWTSDTTISDIVVPDETRTGDVKVRKKTTGNCRLVCTGFEFFGNCVGGTWQEFCEEVWVDSNPLLFEIMPPAGWYPTGENVCPDTNLTIIFNNYMKDQALGMTLSKVEGDGDLTEQYSFSDIEISSIANTPSYSMGINDNGEEVGVLSILDPSSEPNQGFKVFSFDPSNNLLENQTYQIDFDYTVIENGTYLNHNWQFSTTTLEDCECSPFISNVTPSEGGPGECITLYGNCFDGTENSIAIPTNIKFYINHSDDTSEIITQNVGSNNYGSNWITAVIPQNQDKVGEGDFIDIDTTIEYSESGSTASSNKWQEFEVITDDLAQGPCLFNASPDHGYPGLTQVDLTGIRFGTETGEVVFSDNQNASYSTWNNDFVNNAIVPQAAISGDLYIENSTGDESNPIYFTVDESPEEILEIEEIQTSHEEGTNCTNYSECVYRCSDIQSIFNNYLDEDTLSGLEVVQESGGSWTSIDGSISVNGNSLNFDPNSNLAGDTDFRAVFPDTIQDQDGNFLQYCQAADGCYYLEGEGKFIWDFHTSNEIDQIPPEIVSTLPNSNFDSGNYPDRNVSRKPNIEVEFSEAVDSGTIIGVDGLLIEDNIYVQKLDGQNGNEVEIISNEDWNVEMTTNNGFILSLDDGINLDSFTWYRVNVTNIEDLCNNEMDSSYSWEFETNDAAPGVSNWFPDHDNVCPNALIGIVFNTSMYRQTVDMTVNENDENGQVINEYSFLINPEDFGEPYKKRIPETGDLIGYFKVQDTATSNDFKIFIFNPVDTFLANDTPYSVDVGTDLVKNINGDTVSKSWDFYVTNMSDCLCYPVLLYLNPDQGGPGECVTVSGNCFTGTDDQSATPEEIELKNNGDSVVIDSSEMHSISNDSFVITFPAPNDFPWQENDSLSAQMSIKYDNTENILESGVLNNAFVVDTLDPANGPCLLNISPNQGYSGSTEIDLTGLRFDIADEAEGIGFDNTFYNNWNTWENTLITNQDVPANLNPGPVDVNVKNTTGVSNSLPFDILSDLTLMVDIDESCVNGSNQSPTPWPESNQVCTNAGIGARFNKKIDDNTLDNTNVLIKQCNPSNEDFSPSDCNTNVNGNISINSNIDDSEGFLFTPNNNLSGNYWYQIRLKSGENGIKSELSEQLDGNRNGVYETSPVDDYVWHFATKNEICPPESVILSENLDAGETEGVIVYDQGDNQRDYSASALGPDCQILVHNIEWSWESENTAIATLTNSTNASDTATAVGNVGETKIMSKACKAGSTSDCASDQKNLIVATQPEIIDKYPTEDETEVCRNVLSTILFNQKMNSNSLKDNILLLKNPGTPEAPTNLNLNNIGSDFIELNWDDNSFNETGFEIKRRLVPSASGFNNNDFYIASSWLSIGNVSANTTVFMDDSDSLNQNEDYEYKVLATSDNYVSSDDSNLLEIGINPCTPPDAETETCSCVGIPHADECQKKRICLDNDFWGAWSIKATSCETNYALSDSGECLPMPPTTPTQATVLNITNDEIEFSWTDVNREFGYEIKRALSNFGCESNNGSFNWENCDIYANLDDNTTTFLDSDISPNTSYYYKLRACNGVGCSSWTTTLFITSAPMIPANFSASSPVVNDDNTIDVEISWDGSSGADSYILEYTINSNSNTTGLADSNYLDVNLNSNSLYYYRVKACNENDICSNYSSQIEVNTPALPPTNVPTGLSVLNDQITENQVSIEWNNIQNIDKYRVYQAQNASGCMGGSSYSWDNCSWVKEVDNAEAIIDNLDPDTKYFYKLKACNDAGCSDFSAVISVTTAPAKPTALQASSQTVTVNNIIQIYLSWSDNSSTEHGFKIARKESDQDWSQAVFEDAEGEGTSNYEDTTVVDNQLYDYKVLAYRDNIKSSYSNIVTVLAESDIPLVPSGFNGSIISENEIALSWNDNSTKEAYFKIERFDPSDPNTINETFTVSENINTYDDDENIQTNNTYQYKIYACNIEDDCSDSDESDPISISETIPNAPSNLEVFPQTTTKIQIQWQDNAYNEDYFTIERDGVIITSNDPSDSNYVGAGETDYLDEGLSIGTSYSYRVKACPSNDDCSDWSNSICVSTFGVPQKPDNLSLVEAFPSQVEIEWEDNSTNEDDFIVKRGNVEYSVGGSNITSWIDENVSGGETYNYSVKACLNLQCSDFSDVLTVDIAGVPPPPNLSIQVLGLAKKLDWNTLSDATGYNIYYSNNANGCEENGSFSWENCVDFESCDSPPQTLMGPVAQNKYYKIRAENDQGQSDWSNMVEGVSLDPMSQPTNKNAEGISTSTILLTWEDASSPDREAHFCIKKEWGSKSIEMFCVGTNTSYMDTGLDPDTEYRYNVGACDAPSGQCWTNDYSWWGIIPPPLSATTFIAPLDPPVSFSSPSHSENNVNFEWSKVSSATYYELYRSDQDPGGCLGANGYSWDYCSPLNSNMECGGTDPNICTGSDSTVNVNTDYYYKIKACAFGGWCSVWSNDTVEVSTDQVPTVPTGLTSIAQSETEIKLNWDDVVREDSYKIYRNNNKIATPDKNTTQYIDYGLSGCINYDYQIRSCNNAGCSNYSGSVSRLTYCIPDEIGDMTVDSLSSAEIEVTEWDISDDIAEYYKLYRSLNVEGCIDNDNNYDWINCDPIQELSKNDLENLPNDEAFYNDLNNILPETDYYYNLKACSSDGCSDFVPDAVTTQSEPIPNAPDNLSGQALSTEEIEINWNDNADFEDKYIIKRDDIIITDPADDHLPENTNTFPDDNNGNGLLPNTLYSYKVLACNSYSILEGEACTSVGPLTVSTYNIPNVPSDLNAVDIGENSINLNWTNNSSYTDEFILRKLDENGNTLEDISLDPNNLAPANTYLNDGLQSNTTYVYKIKSCNLEHCSVWGAELSVNTLGIPDTPANFDGYSNDPNKIRLVWDDVDLEDKYKITRDGTNLPEIGANTIYFPDDGLEPNTSYHYTIKACNDLGCSASNIIDIQTDQGIPPIPTNFEAKQDGITSIKLTWIDDSTLEDVFKIKRDTVDLTVPANTSEYLDEGLQVNHSYDYKIRACNQDVSPTECSDWSTISTASTDNMDQPTNVNATAQSSSKIEINWDSVDNATSYKVYRSGSANGAYVQIGSTVDSTTYDDTELDQATTYWYKITACHNTSCSNKSNPAGATTDSVIPQRPANLQVVDQTQTTIELEWDDESTLETEFRLKRRDPDGGTSVDIIGADQESYEDTGLEVQTNYDYKIRACNFYNGQDYYCSDWTSWLYNRQTLNLDSPDNLNLTVQDDDIDLTWDSVTNAAFYQLKRNGSVIPDDIDNTNYSDNGLEYGNTYTYKVRSCNINLFNDTNCSDWSSGESITIPEPVPAAPDNLQAAVVSPHNINLTWNDNASIETSFKIKDMNTWQVTEIDGEDHESYSVTGLSASTEYCYKVRACGDYSCSSWSNQVCATTLGGGTQKNSDSQIALSKPFNYNSQWSGLLNDFYIAAQQEDFNEPVNIDIKTFLNEQGQTQANLVLQEVLNSNTEYQILVQGEEQGVKSQYGVPLSNSETWTFETGNDICSLDNIEFTIEEPSELDPTSDYEIDNSTIHVFVPEAEVNFVGRAKSGNVPIGQVSNIYEWAWNWGLSNENIAEINMTTNTGDDPSQATANTYNKDGFTNVASQATITKDMINVPSTLNQNTVSIGKIHSMICENPWSYIDPNTHYTFFYCRDNDPLLPELGE